MALIEALRGQNTIDFSINIGVEFQCLLDVTLVYPRGTPTFWDLLSGRLDGVIVRVQNRAIPADVLGGDPVGDKAYRQRISAWVEALWAEKDALIAQLTSATPAAPA